MPEVVSPASQDRIQFHQDPFDIMTLKVNKFLSNPVPEVIDAISTWLYEQYRFCRLPLCVFPDMETQKVKPFSVFLEIVFWFSLSRVPVLYP